MSTFAVLDQRIRGENGHAFYTLRELVKRGEVVSVSRDNMGSRYVWHANWPTSTMKFTPCVEISARTAKEISAMLEGGAK